MDKVDICQNWVIFKFTVYQFNAWSIGWWWDSCVCRISRINNKQKQLQEKNISWQNIFDKQEENEREHIFLQFTIEQLNELKDTHR